MAPRYDKVRFFCGISDWCRRGSERTLARAVANVERDFAAVVVVEQMLLSFRVLEAALPRLFKGLVKVRRAPPPRPPAPSIL